MKIFKLILALFVKTTWAGCNHPLGFFVYQNDIMMPLYGKSFSKFNILIYGYARAMPTEFSFHDGYIFTKNESGPEYVGIHQLMFLYGTSVPKTHLNLDGTMQIEGKTFFSCSLTDDRIRVIMSSQLHPLCTEVEVYFLPFDRKTGKPVKYWYTPEENENVLVEYYDTCTSSSDTPYYFLAKVNGKMLPLSTTWSHDNERVSIFLLTRWDMNPMKISFHANKAFTNFGNVGFYQGKLSHGAIEQIPIKLDGHKKVEGRQFYACDGLSNDYGNIISVHKSDETCFKVDIYLVEDGLKLYNPNETASITYLSSGENGHENLSKMTQILRSYFQKPLIFYAKVDDIWYVLSPFENPKVRNITWFGLKNDNYMTTEINFRHNYISTQFGNVGFFNGELGYGTGVNRTIFKVNRKRKVINYQFYACRGLYSYFGHVISLNNTDQTCFKVNIYLKRFDIRKIHLSSWEMKWFREHVNFNSNEELESDYDEESESDEPDNESESDELDDQIQEMRYILS